MSVQVALIRMIPRTFAHPTVLTLAVLIATLEAIIFIVPWSAAAVASTALFEIELQLILVSVAVPPKANPNDPEVALIADSENSPSNI